MIRWKIVIHAFIDGKSRLVVGIRASDNNRADTVLKLFLDAIPIHGTPSRVRGDHGVENVRVAEWMEENQGGGRGSYIWGRFVNLLNILICSSNLSGIGASIIAGLRGSGMTLQRGLGKSGRTSLLTWKPWKDLTSTILRTSGSSITFS